ncbi:hypothetical protein ACLOJK_020380 [Asimina triloba]
MAKSKNKLSCISVSSQIISSFSSSSLQNLLLSRQKCAKSPFRFFLFIRRSPMLWLLLVSLFSFIVMLRIGFLPLPSLSSPSPSLPCSIFLPRSLVPTSNSILDNRSTAGSFGDDEGGVETEFWKQPDGMGYRPCLDFSKKYKEASQAVAREKTKYLIAIVAGGLNQQRNQIIDCVVIAKILRAALVVPVLQVDTVWGDERSAYRILLKKPADLVRVSIMPTMHSPNKHTHARLDWDGVLLLRGLVSGLSKDLPSDLQKLKCKVAFHALKFSAPIQELGSKLAERMRSKGPYMALHLRMEMDVWVRTGCLPGLGQEYDEIIHKERQLRPELLTSKLNMAYHQRKLEGLCPLNAFEVTRLLKALGAPRSTRIYWAGGNPLGGREALLPLIKEFPHFYNKENLSLPGELEPFSKKASLLAAIDYMVAANSDVFMASHGGNMGSAMQGHRAYNGHRKIIIPNKRRMLPYFLNSSLTESELNSIIKDLHQGSLGQPRIRIVNSGRDVIAYPVPECMCNGSSTTT